MAAQHLHRVNLIERQRDQSESAAVTSARAPAATHPCSPFNAAVDPLASPGQPVRSHPLRTGAHVVAPPAPRQLDDRRTRRVSRQCPASMTAHAPGKRLDELPRTRDRAVPSSKDTVEAQTVRTDVLAASPFAARARSSKPPRRCSRELSGPQNRTFRDVSAETDAVGTPVARRPPRRSQRARLTHWAPRLGSGVKAAVGPGMQDAGLR